MRKIGAALLLLTTLTFVSNAQSDEENSNGLPVVTLQKWQYCTGCKATVEILANMATREIVKMQEEGLPVGEELNIAPLMEEVCGHHFMDAYQPFVGFACQKLMSEHRNDLFHVFDGTDASSAYSTVKGNIYAKTKDLCLKRARACPSYVYPNTDLPKSERTSCKACSIIVDDLELMTKVLADGRASHEEMVEMLCPTMGYNHQPYNWVEDVCDEMVDDHAEEMVKIMDLRRKLMKSTGLEPRDSLSEKMCRELMSCEEGNEL